MNEERTYSDLELFLELLKHQENYRLRPIQGPYCRLEIFKDEDFENHDLDNEIHIYFCGGRMHPQYE